MFGIGGGELIFILFIALMLFGADKIPEMARTMGKAMAQLKNATNDIKSEIHKGADANGLTDTFREMHGNFADVTANINAEIEKAKTKLLDDPASIAEKVTEKSKLPEAPAPVSEAPLEQTDDITGPIKRAR